MILASASARRQEILAQAGYDFTVCPSSFDERPLKAAQHDPEQLVLGLARGKALAVAGQAGAGEPVVGSDTVVALDGVILGKPDGAEDARAMLRILSGRTHTVCTGAAIVVDGAVASSFVDVSHVEFFQLSDAEIDAYVATGEPLDKAGAYGIQGVGRLIVRRIDGDFFSIMGLPIARLARELARVAGVLPQPQGCGR